MTVCLTCIRRNKCNVRIKDDAHMVGCTGYIESRTNFERVTESPEALAEFIADAMFLYSTSRHIFTIEAVKMASKKEKIDINLDCNYKDVIEWLNEECKE